MSLETKHVSKYLSYTTQMGMRDLYRDNRFEAHLEKRFKILPAGVVSKKDMGDRKMLKAILS